MSLAEINPHIRYARVHHSHSYESNRYRVCYDCRIFYFANAQGTMHISNEKHQVLPGTVIYLPPETKYKFFFADDKDIEIVVLDFDLVDDFAHIKKSLSTVYEDCFDKSKVPRYEIESFFLKPIVRQGSELSDIIYQCAGNFLGKDKFYREKTSALVKLCLFEMVAENAKGYSKLCDKVITYIHENHADTALTNEKISSEFGYHSYYLNTIIKRETSKSMHQHLLDYRVEIAKNYLLTTDYSIDHVSWRSGFSSTSYFIKSFREKTGTTPNKYRKSVFHL